MTPPLTAATDVTYVATDDDNTVNAGTDTITYSLEPSSQTAFSQSSAGSVGRSTKAAATAVDYEKKNEYSLTVIATSPAGQMPDDSTKMIDKMYDSVAVTVKVVNTDDPGTVSLTQREPQVESSVTATVDDVDGDVSYVEWQWFSLDAANATTAATDPEQPHVAHGGL